MNTLSYFSKTVIASFVAAVLSQMALQAENLPAMRPALVGSGSNSLVNLVDTKHLMERGFQHGAIYFMARIDPNGYPSYSRVWGETEKVKPLRDEVRERLAQARFVPAVYNHRNVYAWFHGTLAFSVVDGKPHLRIFASQELPELQKESDFIAPQSIWLPGKIFDTAQVKNPWGGWSTGDKPGIADFLLTVDSSGHVTDVRLEHMDPPDKTQYADEAIKLVKQWLMLPAYRNGKPVDSTTHLKYYFIPAYYRLQ